MTVEPTDLSPLHYYEGFKRNPDEVKVVFTNKNLSSGTSGVIKSNF